LGAPGRLGRGQCTAVLCVCVYETLSIQLLHSFTAKGRRMIDGFTQTPADVSVSERADASCRMQRLVFIIPLVLFLLASWALGRVMC